MKPTISLLQGRPYTPAVKTDLRESFRLIREAQRIAAEQKREQESADTAAVQATFARRRAIKSVK